MGSNVGGKQQQQQHNSSVNHPSGGESKDRGVENGPHHQSSTFSSSIENSCHERKKRPSGSTLSSSTCNQLVTSGTVELGLLTMTTSRNTSPSSQSSQSSNSSSSWNRNNRINVTSPTPHSSLNKRSSSSNFQDGNRLTQMGIKNTNVSHSNQFNSSPLYESKSSKKASEIRMLSPSNCNSFERSEPWNGSNRQQQEVCGGSSGSLSSLLNPITRKQLQDPFYRPFVS